MQSSIGRNASYVFCFFYSPLVQSLLLLSVCFIRILVMGMCPIRISYTKVPQIGC